jgi:hypothetical protein
MRRLPAALNPTFWPVSGLTNTPLRLPGCAASSGGRPHALGMRRRRCNALGACVRLPLRGQHRLARLRCRQAPCFRLTARAGAARASTKTRASVGAVPAASRQNRPSRGRRRAPRPHTAARRARPRGQAWPVRAGRALCYRMRRVRCSRAHCAHAVKRETGGGASPGLCCPRNGTPPARRGCSARAQAALDATAPAGGKAAARQAASPDTGRRRGERAARRTPGPRGTDRSAVCPRPRASPDPPMHCLSAGPVPLAVSFPLPCRGACRGAPDEPRVARRRGPR